jgi:hypothetical protein
MFLVSVIWTRCHPSTGKRPRSASEQQIVLRAMMKYAGRAQIPPPTRPMTRISYLGQGSAHPCATRPHVRDLRSA